MRSYPRNSPEAAARIVALTLVADGHFCRDELAAIDRAEARRRLGITPERLQQVIHGLCDDLMALDASSWRGSAALDEATLAAMLDEIDDPLLRLEVLQLCILASTADGRLEDGENRIIRVAVARWGLCGRHGPAAQGARPCRS